MEFLEHISWQWAFGLALIENILVCFLALGLSSFFLKRYKQYFLYPSLETPHQRNLRIVWITIVANTAITCIGLVLFWQGMIKLSSDFSWDILLHFLVLVLMMDFLMFLFHYIIHKTFIYRLVHLLHHREPNPSPVDLFVLHPLEVLGFGGLWILILCVCTLNFYAIVIYAVVNILFGIIGHLGVEPFPKFWLKNPILRYISTSTFHFQHHQHESCNFGFYTIFWDLLFKTLHSKYFDTFMESKKLR